MSTAYLPLKKYYLIDNYLAVKSESEDVQNVGGFSCCNRNIVVRFHHLNLQSNYQDCSIIVYSSTPVLLTSIQGDFVLQVQKIIALIVRNVPFKKEEDRMELCVPVEN